MKLKLTTRWTEVTRIPRNWKQIKTVTNASGKVRKFVKT